MIICKVLPKVNGAIPVKVVVPLVWVNKCLTICKCMVFTCANTRANGHAMSAEWQATSSDSMASGMQEEEAARPFEDVTLGALLGKGR